MIPQWLAWLAILSLGIGGLSALWMAFEMRRRPPKMGVMAAVWPLCALFGGPVLIWFHARWGGHAGHGEGHEHGHGHGHGGGGHGGGQPFAASVAKGALHCGAGCSLGDLLAESSALLFPSILTVFGLGSVFAERIFAVWVYDFVWAFGLGVIFQYFAIAPMRGLGLRAGLAAAAKADAASLASWQVGMYGTMALAHFVVFPAMGLGRVDAGQPLFWFAMQIAMWAGFCTAYPVNWLLIRRGVKERM